MFGYFKKRGFRKELEEALADGVLTEEEARYLGERSEELGIDQEYSNKVRLKHFNKQVGVFRENVKQTRRLSHEDAACIKMIASDLQIDVELGPDIRIAGILWAWENGHPISPEPIAAPILLGRGETCYFATTANWKQVKTFRQHIGYSGFSASIRIMKGLSYRTGNIKPQYHAWEGMADISNGTLYVTNKKVAFDGATRSTSIIYGKLINSQVYLDGIELRKFTGKSDYFKTDRMSAEYIYVLIQHFASQG